MRKKDFILLISFVFCLGSTIEAQENRGSLTIYADATITQMVEHYQNLNLNNPGADGFRIQIFFDSGNNSKQEALTVKTQFEKQGTNDKVYLIFEEPYYKVRIGNFRTKLDATHALNRIISLYPGAFIVPDYIEFPN